MDEVEKVLEEVTVNAHLKQTYQHAGKIVWKKRKQRVLMTPLLVGVVIGTIGAWWLGVIWFGVMLFGTVSSEMVLTATRIQLYQSMRFAAKLAAAIADDMDMELPERIREQANGPEWPPLSMF